MKINSKEKTIKQGRQQGALGSVVEINPKLNVVIPDTEKVGFISMADVTNDAQISNIQERDYKDVKKGFTYFRPSDVLFAKITPCMENGKGALVPDTYRHYFGSTEFFVLRAGKYVAPDFIYYILNQPGFRKLAERNMTGSAGQRRVPKEFLENFKIKIPITQEQEKIIKILASIDKEASLNKILGDKLTQLKNGLVQDLLSGKKRAIT